MTTVWTSTAQGVGGFHAVRMGNSHKHPGVGFGQGLRPRNIRVTDTFHFREFLREELGLPALGVEEPPKPKPATRTSSLREALGSRR